MELKELYYALGEFPQDYTIFLESPHSHRGNYCDIAFEPTKSTVGDACSCVGYAIGRTYEGYKGGLFTMESDTPCYIAYEGCCGDPIVSLEADHENKIVKVITKQDWTY